MSEVAPPPIQGVLAGLADLSLPPPVPWTPQTPAWAVLGAVLLIVALWAAWRALRRYRTNRYRREALAELSLLERGIEADAAQRAAALAALAALLKRTALAAWPREQVAASSGQAWGRFLALHAGRAKDAAPALARLVGDIEYRGEAALAGVSGADARALVQAGRQWIAGIVYQLDHPWLLALLPAPLLVWWLLAPYRETSASVRLPFFHEVASAAGLTPASGAVVPRRNGLQWVLAPLAWGLVVLALARPQFIEPPIEKVQPARDLLLALDLSQSMETRDFKRPDGTPDARVQAVRQVVRDFVARRQGDRIGLIVFGDAPYPLAPFTMDHELVRVLIDGTIPGMAGPRTALGDAVGLAIKMFDDSKAQQKVLIVLTDGNDTASKMPPSRAAEIAKERGVVVHTIGIGDAAATGEDKVDLPTLRAMAATTGGSFHFGTDQRELQSIYATLDRITPENHKTLSWRPRRELFMWPLGAAVAIVLAYHLAMGLYTAALRVRRRSA